MHPGTVVAAHHKYGVPPLLEDGVSLDLDRGLQVPVDPESLWAQLKPGEPYKMPVLMVRRNCGRVIEAGGLQIKELEDHLAPHCACASQYVGDCVSHLRHLVAS